MKVALGTLEFDDDQRKLLAADAGAKGLATREHVRDMAEKVVNAHLATLEAASLDDGGDADPDSAPTDDDEPKSKKDKKGKKNKDKGTTVEPEPEAEPEPKAKKDKKGKKNKG